jgi:hypothetical protein
MEDRLGVNFEVVHLVPPYNQGDILPPQAFTDPKHALRLVEIGAIRHTHDDPTVVLADDATPAKTMLPFTPKKVEESDAEAEERLRKELLIAQTKLAAAEAKCAATESRLKEAEGVIESAKQENGDLRAEVELLKESNAGLQAENNKMRLTTPVAAPGK